MAAFTRRSVLCAALALAFAQTGGAQTNAPMPGQPQPPSARGNEIPAEVIDDPRVKTVDLGPADAPWRVFIGHPRVAPPPGGYSVIFALDGNATFPLLWRARETLAPDAPVVIVGIGYPTAHRFDTLRRFFDLTPLTAPEHTPNRDGPVQTGGREAFLDFIEGAVFAEVARHVPVDPSQRTLFGHSLGGLFTLYTLYTRPQLFSRYVAADPSIWWNGGSLLQEETAFRQALASATAASPLPESRVRLLVENSGRQPERPTGGDTSRSNPAYSGQLAAERLAQTGGLGVFYRLFPTDSHASMLAPALADGFLFHLDRVADGIGLVEQK